MDTDHILDVAIEAAKAAGRVIVESRGAGAIHEKSAHHYVTEVDLKSEQTILKILRARYPQHAIVSEESHADERVDGPGVWIIDPLDGTNNFSNGIPIYCVSIAFASRGRVQVAAIYDPNRDELFSAVRGRGSRLNGVPIKVSDRAELKHAIICTGFYYDRGLVMRSTLRAIETLYVSGVRGIRRLGSAALDLCWVGCGRLDGFFEYRLAPWDYSAGWLIVAEAGGVCTDRDGGTMTLEAGNVMAANPSIHQALAQRISWQAMSLPGPGRHDEL
jgi:myo-inositol-1(or 4)-monophosphatase